MAYILFKMLHRVKDWLILILSWNMSKRSTEQVISQIFWIILKKIDSYIISLNKIFKNEKLNNDLLLNQFRNSTAGIRLL